MSLEHVKATPVANADAYPVVTNPTGNGAEGYTKEVGGSLVVPAAASTDSTLRFCRVPTNAKVKSVRLTTQTQAAGTVDFGVYYPTTGPTAKADLAANAIDQDFFASGVTVTALGNTDITNESGTYTGDKWLLPLWQALGLASDPTGFFDIVGTVAGTPITTGTGIMALSVEFVM